MKGVTVLLQWVARWVLAVVFVYAGVVKVIDPAQFLSDIESFRLVSGRFALWTAFLLPWLEIVAGLSLLSDRLRVASGGVLVVLLGVFIVAIAVALWRDIDISCGCFGGDGSSTDAVSLLLRDIVLLAVTVFAAGLYSGGGSGVLNLANKADRR